MTFTKQDPNAAAGFYETEAAGLRWLGEASDGVPVAEVLQVSPASITLRRYATVPATATAASDFGARLARTHLAGAALRPTTEPPAQPSVSQLIPSRSNRSVSVPSIGSRPVARMTKSLELQHISLSIEPS